MIIRQVKIGFDGSPDCRGAVAAAQAFVTAVHKKDGTSLKNWMGYSETQLSESREVSYCAASDGDPFNCKVSVFHPDTLKSILEAVNLPVFDVDINTDLLHINGTLCVICPTAMHPGCSDDYLDSIKEKRCCWCRQVVGG